MPSSGLIKTITLPNGNTYDVKDSALPVVSSSDNGKVLTVSGGIWSAETPQSSMPTVLSVTAAAGSWSSATPPTQTIHVTAEDGAGNCSDEIQGIKGTARILVNTNMFVHLYRSGVLQAAAFLALIALIRYTYGVYKRTLA